jgi:hypothetical protein
MEYKRLTDPKQVNCIGLSVCGGGCDTCPSDNEYYRKLSAYEDSDLSPEQVQEFAKAKAEGRLVVLPCKVGDKVWMILETVNDKFEIAESVLTKVFHTFKDSYISCWIDCPGIGDSLEFRLSDFGKTVFITHEAAEIALKALGGDIQ